MAQNVFVGMRRFFTRHLNVSNLLVESHHRTGVLIKEFQLPFLRLCLFFYLSTFFYRNGFYINAICTMLEIKSELQNWNIGIFHSLENGKAATNKCKLIFRINVFSTILSDTSVMCSHRINEWYRLKWAKLTGMWKCEDKKKMLENVKTLLLSLIKYTMSSLKWKMFRHRIRIVVINLSMVFFRNGSLFSSFMQLTST